MIRIVSVIVVVLMAAFVGAYELRGCEGAGVQIMNVSDIMLNTDHVRCHVEGEPKGVDMVGWFFPNQDIRVTSGGQEMIVRLENGVLVGIEPEFARPSVRIECEPDVVQQYIDVARWPGTFDDVRAIVLSCQITAERVVVVPQVTALRVMFAHVQGGMDLFEGPVFSVQGLAVVVRDVARLLFAGPHAMVMFGLQFAGVFV